MVGSLNGNAGSEASRVPSGRAPVRRIPGVQVEVGDFKAKLKYKRRGYL